jgi:hypothetical protein
MQTKLKELAQQFVNNAIEDAFYKLHQEFKTESGDIAPEQVLKLDELIEEISQIAIQVINQNK